MIVAKAGRNRWLVCGVALTAALLGAGWLAPGRAAQKTEPPRLTRLTLPWSFEPNVGQAPPDVSFIAHHGRAVFLFSSRGVRAAAGAEHIALEVHGAAEVQGEGAEPLPGTASYFLGNEPSKWRTALPTYARVVFRGVYEGIDLVWHGERGQLEYDFVVAPGADVSRVRLASTGDVQWEQPSLFQLDEDGTRHPVEGRFATLPDGALTFAIGDYDRQRTLIIDPVLSWSTYLGGASFDSGTSLTLDAAGNVWVTGYTASANFPTSSAVQGSMRGTEDALVAKLSPTGVLLYSTYLGGDTFERGYALAVDATGAAYVTGYSESTNFPTTAGAAQTTSDGTEDCFVAKLSPSGASLVYATYLGGNSTDECHAIALDAAGSAVVTGYTGSTNFPKVGALQNSRNGTHDAFVSKVNPAGSAFDFSTYLGGNALDYGSAIVLDAAGNVYVAGHTASTDFPTVGPLQASSRGANDAFIARLPANGSALTWSTYLGGSGNDDIGSLRLDPSGDLFITGYTASADFPVVNAAQATFGGGTDAFIARVAASGTSLTWATFLGGNGNDYGLSLALDVTGGLWVAGTHSSTNFPSVNPLQAAGGGQDGFLARLSSSGALELSSSFGGTGSDVSTDLALDGSGSLWLVGDTRSTNFPILNAAQPTLDGGSDVYVLRMRVNDGGAPDSGTSSADGGAGSDGGATGSDGGASGSDGGLVVTDGGTWDAAGRRVLSVGCGCGTAQGSSALLALLALLTSRARRCSPSSENTAARRQRRRGRAAAR